jgi:hypothetical protein
MANSTRIRTAHAVVFFHNNVHKAPFYADLSKKITIYFSLSCTSIFVYAALPLACLESRLRFPFDSVSVGKVWCCISLGAKKTDG